MPTAPASPRPQPTSTIGHPASENHTATTPTAPPQAQSTAHRALDQLVAVLVALVAVLLPALLSPLPALVSVLLLQQAVLRM